MAESADVADLVVSVLAAPTESPQLLTAAHTLGRMSFGRSTAPVAAMPVQQVAAPLLHPTGDLVEERWLSRKPLHDLDLPGVRGRFHDELLFGVIEVDEADFHAAVDPVDSAGSTPLERASRAAYTRLFSVLDRTGFSHLWRAWNYMADINRDTHGVERYRQFNAGRQQAFTEAARNVTGNVPAACAIGVRSGPLSLAFLAGMQPTSAVDNPRQVSAWRYPVRYGRQPPTFARASLARVGAQEWLLLSGTASIVGHETVHVGDVRRQVEETLANIEAVIAEANQQSGRHAAGRFGLHDFQFRVYVRHAADLHAIREVLAAYLAPLQSVLYVHADICRQDLDVEIEGAAWRPLNRASS